ncbi:SU10 major capsid protein [Agrobacterium rosae]|uniref:Head protein n=1 Tax=Agrobacterium rosae TaxID=1972867 RepID=A0AAE5RU56_9HYPH|nr:DUF5309 family protein [Agrobacterium rosae]KAA3511609.1 head protein [Agrobacterium rosae]KAA3518967.1 head protein [Agrobacterium rosae]MQB49305.1 head protein [Agrobacterium rosae]POO49147.1 head protein [Agrobacterium rosae]
MPTLTTVNHAGIHEDLSNIINMLEPTETPFISSIGKTKASAVRSEFLMDELAAADKNNALAEGADATDSTLTTPTRLGNICQIFQKDIRLSSTLNAVNTAGAAKDELSRLVVKKGLELKRDQEAAFVSSNASVATGTRKLGGMEAWISTNALHGAGGSSTGYAGGIVNAPTAGTARPLTEALFISALQKIWEQGGTPKDVIAPGTLKQKISTFNGGATKQQNADKKTVNQAVDLYVSDFGTVSIVPHRFMSTNVVIAYDPELWKNAVLRNVQKVELAKTGDSERYMLVTETTLQSLNEKGSAKIADLNG